MKENPIILKYGFCNKSFQKDESLNSWTLLQHICPHFWAWLLLYSAITPKCEDKYVVKVFNWSDVHLSEMTCYKIHTLIGQTTIQCVFSVYFDPKKYILKQTFTVFSLFMFINFLMRTLQCTESFVSPMKVWKRHPQK